MKTGALLNGLTLCALALAASAWTMVFLQDSAALNQKGIAYEGNLPLNQSFEVNELTSFTLNGRDGLAVFPGSSVEVTWDETSDDVEVQLTSGTVLAYTLASELNIRIVTPSTTVLSQNNMVLVKTDEEAQSLTVYAIEHPALVSFFDGETELNALNVPGGYRMGVSLAKITETLAKLRLTKLSKEFPVFELSDEDMTEEMNQALQAVRDHYEASTIAFLNELQANSDLGPSLTGLGSQLSKGYTSFQDALTLVPTAKERLLEVRKEDSLIYAVSNYLSGDPTSGAYWLSQWSTYEQDPQFIKDYYSSLFFVLPGDELYPVKQAMAELLFPHEDAFLELRREYAEIENLLERASHVDAEQAYLNYEAQFEKLLDSGALDNSAYFDEINREYVLLELMLRSNSVFYTTDSTHLLKVLEQKIFTLAGSDSDLDEERQAFIQSKLRFLSNLFNYVLDKKITVEEASDLAEELIYEAEAYLNAITSQVAVRDYFKSKLTEYSLSVQFMNSPEFYTYDSFEEGLVDYKKKVADLEDLNTYIQNIRSGEEEEAVMPLEEATQIAKDDLYTHGIQYKDVNPLGDSANRLFEIEGGRTAGYTFTGKYDREGQILYDVVVGEVRFSTGLSLDNVRSVVESVMTETGTSTEEVTEVETPETSQEGGSLTESVALELVQSQFEEAGLDIASFTFEIVDLEANEFTFEGLASAFNLPVSGTYDADTGRLTEIIWEINEEPQTLPDLDLPDFEEALEASYTAITE